MRALVPAIASLLLAPPSPQASGRGPGLQAGPNAVAHERVPFGPGDRAPQPLTPRPSPTDGMPDLIAYRGLALPVPDDSPEPAPHERVLRPSPLPGDVSRSTAHSPPTPPTSASRAHRGGPADPVRTEQLEPDGFTGADPVLHYAAVFQPSVAPFKRFDAKDTVAPDFTLRVSDRRLVPVPVGGAPAPGRELFVGSVVVDASSGAPVPIPSVAPGARILRYRTSPRFAARFYRDGADNDYVSVRGSGLVRLSFLTDAPAAYFGAPIPAFTAADVPEARRPRLPANVAAAALRVLARLGVARDGSLREALARLVAHFREYRAGDRVLPASGEPLFRALALGGEGACRHRAFAFTILAQALGVPARYVSNEAHAFAEVWVGRAGWRRVDLGGASPELVVHGAEGKVAHRPRHEDPFPRPPGFDGVYSNWTPPGMSEPPPLPPGTMLTPMLEDPASDMPQPAPPARAAGRETTRIALESVQRDVLRGDVLALEGRVETESGQGAPGLRVDVFLCWAGTDDRRRIGVLLTDTAGGFQARLPLPPDLRLGRYRLDIEVSGNERYASARFP